MRRKLLLVLIFLFIINCSYWSFAENLNMDYIIVPGRSLGNTKIGESKAEVLKRLGKPSQIDEDCFRYHSKDKKQYVEIHFNKGKVEEIKFTSSSFDTIEGINIKNFSEAKFNDQFDKWKFQWRYIQLRYTLKTGGLTFYAMNVDVPSDNEEYSSYYIGIVHSGKNPKYEPISGGNWEKWDGDPEKLYQ